MPNMMLLHRNAASITHQARAPPSGGSIEPVDRLSAAMPPFASHFTGCGSSCELLIVCKITPLPYFSAPFRWLLLWFAFASVAGTMRMLGELFGDNICSSAMIGCRTLGGVGFLLLLIWEVRFDCRLAGTKFAFGFFARRSYLHRGNSRCARVCVNADYALCVISMFYRHAIGDGDQSSILTKCPGSR